MDLSGDWWHPEVALATITAGEATPHSVTLQAQAGNEVFQSFWIYIPASANIPLDELERWRQELMHGAVPQNYTGGTGHAATTTQIDAPGYNILNPTTGAVTAIASTNLSDSSALARNNQANTYGAYLQDFSGATIKLPAAAGYASGANGGMGYDTTNFNWHGWLNGADSLFALMPASGLTSGHCVEFSKSTNSWSLQDAGSACGSGSGTVNNASQYSPVYYSASGSANALSGVTPFTGLAYYSTGAAPAAATGAQIVSTIGTTAVTNATNFTGSLSGDVTGTQTATSVGKINGGSVPASANLIATNSSSQPIAATAHNESVPRTCATTNSGNAYTCTTSPSFTPAAGDTISINFNAANTGSATLAMNGAAAATIMKWGNSSTLAANDVLAGHWISATFDGTYWQLEGQLGNANAKQVNGGSMPASATVLGTNSSGQPVAAGTTGSGNVVLASSPTLTTPVLGAASATSITTSASSTLEGSANLFNNAAAAANIVEIQAGTTAAQTEEIQWQNYSGTAEWLNSVDTSYTYHIKDAANSLDRVTIYQGAGNTNINAGSGAYAVCLNCASSSGTSGLLVQNGAASPSTVLTVTGAGNTTATGFVSGKFFIGSSTMTLTAGAAAGTSPSIACAANHVCDGVSGTVTLTTGTSPTTGTLATLGFPNTHSNYANCLVSTESSSAVITSNTWTESTTAITITANTAPAASTAYTVKYWCGGN